MNRLVQRCFVLLIVFSFLLSYPSFSSDENSFPDPWEPTDATKTPQDVLFESGTSENIASAEWALKSGAQVNPTDKTLSPLHIAAQYKKKKMIEYFLKNGADINYKDFMGNNVLHTAIKGFPTTTHLSLIKRDFIEEKDFIAFLLSKGVRINDKNDSGLTPLFYCYDPEILEFLVLKGADPNIKNTAGATAKETCEFMRNMQIRSEISHWIESKKHKLMDLYYEWKRP